VDLAVVEEVGGDEFFRALLSLVEVFPTIEIEYSQGRSLDRQREQPFCSPLHRT